jgi:hypothetical protein
MMQAINSNVRSVASYWDVLVCQALRELFVGRIRTTYGVLISGLATFV